MREIYQNQAASAMVFFASAGEHITGVVGINSVTASASKDGAAFALITATASAGRGVGWYNFTLNSGWTDTLGDLVLNISAASADPVDLKFWVTYPKFGASAALASAVSAVHATATQITDKTGYALTAAYDLAKTAAQATAVESVLQKTDVATSSRFAATGALTSTVSAQFATAHYISDSTYLGAQGLTATYTKASGAATELGVGNIDVALSSRFAATGALTGTVSAVHATATQVSDKTGYALTAAYDLAKTAAQATAMDLVVVKADVAMSSRLAATATEVGRIDVNLSSRFAATGALTGSVSAVHATATQITDSVFIGAKGATATYDLVKVVSATATDIKDFLGGTFTVDPAASAATAFRMDGTTTLKAWTLSAASFASAVPAFIKRTI